MICNAVDMDVENLLYFMLREENMDLYPKGIYIPYALEPVAEYGTVTDKYGQILEVGEYSDEMWTNRGIVLNDLYPDFRWNPYIPYRPMRVLIDYCKRYLDRKIRDKDILVNCPILNSGPIGYSGGYLTLTDVAELLYNVKLPSSINNGSTDIDEALDKLYDTENTLYDVTCIGTYISVSPIGNIYEIRYKELLEEYEANGKVNICKRRNDTLDRGI